MSSKTTNLNLTKPSEDEFYDINVQNENMNIIDREIGGLKQPTYEVSTAMSDLNSGEMITVAFGKIAKAVSTLISHVASKATSSVLGHVKLSDSTSSTSASTAGVAATPKAVKAAYDLANSNTKKIGTTDISGIGDGTVTGAIVNNKEAIEDVSQSLSELIIKSVIINQTGQFGYIKDCIGSVVYKNKTAFFHIECELSGTIDLPLSLFGIDTNLRTPNGVYGAAGNLKLIASSESLNGNKMYAKIGSNSNAVQIVASATDFYGVTFSVSFA